MPKLTHKKAKLVKIEQPKQCHQKAKPKKVSHDSLGTSFKCPINHGGADLFRALIKCDSCKSQLSQKLQVLFSRGKSPGCATGTKLEVHTLEGECAEKWMTGSRQNCRLCRAVHICFSCQEEGYRKKQLFKGIGNFNVHECTLNFSPLRKEKSRPISLQRSKTLLFHRSWGWLSASADVLC